MPAATWQNEVSVSLNKIGDLKLQSGDSAGALVAYEESLAIHRGLARTDPGNAEWQWNLSFDLNDVGDLKLQSGQTSEAPAAYEESLAIARDLAGSDLGNARW